MIKNYKNDQLKRLISGACDTAITNREIYLVKHNA